MHYPYMLDKCRLGGSPTAGMVIRSGEPAQRRFPAGRQVLHPFFRKKRMSQSRLERQRN